MKSKVIIVVNIVSILIGCLLTYVLSSNSSETSLKVRFVNSQTLFRDFELTKELQRDIEVMEDRTRTHIDSLKFNLNVFAKTFDEKSNNKDEFNRKYEYLYRQISKKEEQFKAEGTKKITNFDTQILTQLNGYIEEYAKENDVELLLGSGDGAVLYSEDRIDVTGEVLIYINTKYNK